MKLFNFFKKPKPVEVVVNPGVVRTVYEISCITKIILKDLEEVSNFKIKENWMGCYNQTEIINKVRKYRIRYSYNGWFSWSLTELENYVFNVLERELVEKSLKKFDEKITAAKQEKRKQKDSKKLKQWFPECYK